MDFRLSLIQQRKESVMYYKEIETNKEVHAERMRLLKSQAAERRANNAKRKKANKKASEE